MTQGIQGNLLLKRNYIQISAIATLAFSLGCQEQAFHQAPLTPPSLKATLSFPQKETIRVRMNVNQTVGSFRTQAGTEDTGIRFISIAVSDLAAQTLASTPNLISVSNGLADASLQVPSGNLLRLVTVTFYDAQQKAFGSPMKGYYRSSGDPNKVTFVNVNWQATPTTETIEKLYQKNAPLAQSLDENKLQNLIDRFVITPNSPQLQRYPSALDTDELSTAIDTQNQLPSTIDPASYKPATMRVKVSGVQGDNVTFKIPFLGRTEAFNADDSKDIEVPPGSWPLKLTLPPSYFGSLPLNQLEVAHGDTRQLLLALSPSQVIDNGVSLFNTSKLLNPTFTSASQAPVLKMPSSGKLTTIPNNLETPVVFSWEPGNNDVFNITLTFPDGRKYNFVTENTTWTPDNNLWKTIMTAQSDSDFHTQATGDCTPGRGRSCQPVDIGVSIQGGKKSELDDFNPGNDTVRKVTQTTTVRVSALPAQGDIYYWTTTNSGNVMKVPANASAIPQTYHGFSLGNSCSGCHTISHNMGGQKLIAITNHAGGRKILLLDRETKTQVHQIPGGTFSVWDREGKKLVYSTSVAMPDGTTSADLRVYDRDTGADSALPGASDPTMNEIMPTWSANGQTLTFVRYPASMGLVHALPALTSANLYTIPAEGGEATPLPGLPEEDRIQYLYPTYSPDGNWIAFIRRDWSNVNLSFSSLRTMASYATSDWLRLAQSSHLYVIPSTGGTPKLLANASTGEVDSWPKWSPEGNWIAFSSHRLNGSAQIFVSQFNRGTGDADAPFLLPGPSGTANHIPEWAMN